MFNFRRYGNINGSIQGTLAIHTGISGNFFHTLRVKPTIVSGRPEGEGVLNLRFFRFIRSNLFISISPRQVPDTPTGPNRYT